MKKRIILFLLIINPGLGNITFAQEAFSVGPMVHFTIGNKFRPSYGLEIAYWNFDHFPYSVDFGVDFEKSKFRMYSELQTGVIFTGASLGPCLEFKKDSPVQLGLQGSCWINYIVGLDFRFRFMKGKDYYAPGTYLKVPFVKGGYDSNSSSHYHHHHHWD